MKELLKENNIKIRSWTNLVGTILQFGAGLFFVLFIDLYVKFRTASGEITPIAIWLFAAIVFAVGAGIFYFFGDSQKHKKTLTIVLKGVGIVLSIGFIVYIFVFLNWVETSEKIMYDSMPIARTTSIISLIVNILALVVLIINYVFSIIFVSEDY